MVSILSQYSSGKSAQILPTASRTVEQDSLRSGKAGRYSVAFATNVLRCGLDPEFRGSKEVDNRRPDVLEYDGLVVLD